MRLISTLGWTARVVIDAARILEPDENIVFYGYVDDEERKKVMAALKEVERRLKDVHTMQVEPMNFHDCIGKMKTQINDESVVNITGGTKIMAFSLALTAALREVPVIYVVTEDGRTIIKRLPIMLSQARRNFFRLNKKSTQYQMLQILIRKYGGMAKMKDLRRELSREYSTLSDAKTKLLKANLLIEKKEGREKVLQVTDAAYLFWEGE